MPHEETEHRYGPEMRDRAREMKETKEDKEDSELKAAAAMERADYLVHEVKTSQNQMQNILLHMQSVLKAIRELRTALQIPQGTSDAASIERDKKRLEDLQKKIAAYRNELVAMKGDLLIEQIRILRENNPDKSEKALQEEARILVEAMLDMAEITTV